MRKSIGRDASARLESGTQSDKSRSGELTQHKARRRRREHARRNQEHRVRPVEGAVHGRANADREQRDDERRDGRLHLNQRDVSDHHVHHVAPGLHVSQVRLRRHPRRETHVQIPLQPEQRRHEDEQFGDVREHFPVLQGETKHFNQIICERRFDSTGGERKSRAVIRYRAER